ncbi:MAG TPA: hypothetical protein VNT30_14805 [Stellaceae bacterium]|nr:hypothetical protein [Stellaceae bacterium]
MRMPRLIEVVVVLSLGLNCFVLGGYAYSRLQPPAAAFQPPDRRLEQLVGGIGVDTTSKPFLELRQTFGRAQRQFYAQNSLLLDDAFEELGKTPPSQERLDSVAQQMTANRQVLHQTISVAMVKFIATLTPEQHKAMVEALADRTNGLGQPLRNGLGN